MSPRFVLGRENVPCVAEVVNKSLKADCTDFNTQFFKRNLRLCTLGKHILQDEGSLDARSDPRDQP